MDFYRHLKDFLSKVEQGLLKGHEIKEIIVGKGLFMDIMYGVNEELFDSITKTPDHIIFNSSFGKVKVSWRD